MAGLSEALGSPEMELGPQEASSGYSLWHPEISSPLASGFVRKLRERIPFIPRALITDVASTILLTGRVFSSHGEPGRIGPAQGAPPAWILGASSG